MKLTDALKQKIGGNLGSWNDDGERVMSARSALKYGPVWYALQKQSGHLAQLPLVLHKRLDRGAEKATDHPAYRLTKTEPNWYMTPADWKEQMIVNYWLYGASYNYVVRIGGKAEHIIPLDSDRTWVTMHEGDKWFGHYVYANDPLTKFVNMQGATSGMVWMPQEDVLHVHGMSFNGWQGIPVTDVAGESFQLGLDAEKQIRKLAKKGFSGSVILEIPHGILAKDADRAAFYEAFKQQHSGTNGSDVAMVRDGIKVNTLNMSGKDAQWIEQRIFQRQEAAIWFGLEEIIGDDSSVSYSSLAEKHLAYLTNCLNKILVKTEEACNRTLLTAEERRADSHFFKFNTNALMRMDQDKQTNFLTKLVASEIISRNEAREKFDLNPYEGGDSYRNPYINVEDEREPEPEQEDDNPQARTVIVAQLQHMIGVEKKRVNQAAKSKNFVNQVGKFYSKWQDNISVTIERLGGDYSMGVDYCRESQDQLIQLMQNTDPAALAGAVDEMTALWDTRAEQLADQILGE